MLLNIKILNEQGTPDANEISSLWSLSAECPLASGMVVHEARFLLTYLELATWDDFTNDCQDIPIRSLAKVKQEQKPILSPNPSTGVFTIDIHNRNSPSTIDIYNIEGKQIMHFSDYTRNQPIDLRSEINGVYIIHVLDKESGELSILKYIKVE